LLLVSSSFVCLASTVKDNTLDGPIRTASAASLGFFTAAFHQPSRGAMIANMMLDHHDGTDGSTPSAHFRMRAAAVANLAIPLIARRPQDRLVKLFHVPRVGV